MKAEDIVYKILFEKDIYLSKNYPINNLGCSISTNNAQLIIKHYEDTIGMPCPILLKQIILAGIKLFPSDYISDTEFGIFEIRELELLK